MSDFPSVSGKSLLKILAKLGFEVVRVDMGQVLGIKVNPNTRTFLLNFP